MAMDFGSAALPGATMFENVVTAMSSTASQLSALTNESLSYTSLAITPMLGLNDVSDECFTLDDAKHSADASHLLGVETRAWSLDVDHPGTNTQVSPYASGVCSGTQMQSVSYAFASAFLGVLGEEAGKPGLSKSEITAVVIGVLAGIALALSVSRSFRNYDKQSSGRPGFFNSTDEAQALRGDPETGSQLQDVQGYQLNG